MPADVVSVAKAPLTGGRTGAAVVRLDALFRDGVERSYVQKTLPRDTWRDAAMESTPGAEVALFESGATRDLPEPLAPTMFAVDLAEDGAYRMWMHDVSAGIRPRGAFTDADERTLVEGVARLHAAYWDSPRLAELPLATMAGTTRIFAEPLVALAGGPAAVATSPAWVRSFLDEFAPMGVYLPRFLELLGPDDADFFLHFVVERGWLRLLDDAPMTLVHGDLRRANISFGDDGTLRLIDWEFAARGPGATDLAWHWFLHFWAYPGDDRLPEEHDPLLDVYVAAVEAALGRAIDRPLFDRTWDVAWLRALSQLGYCLADPAVGDDVDSATIEAVRGRCTRAIARARRALDAHV